MASLITLLVLVIFIPAIYGAYIKLSARLLRQEGITWKQGFVFGLTIVIYSFLGYSISLRLGYSLPILPGIAAGFLANAIIGGWFFSKRGTSVEGGPLGWGGAVKLTGLAFALLVLTGAVLTSIPELLSTGPVP
jgi:hypothetical protein